MSSHGIEISKCRAFSHQNRLSLCPFCQMARRPTGATRGNVDIVRTRLRVELSSSMRLGSSRLRCKPNCCGSLGRSSLPSRRSSLTSGHHAPTATSCVDADGGRGFYFGVLLPQSVKEVSLIEQRRFYPTQHNVHWHPRCFGHFLLVKQLTSVPEVAGLGFDRRGSSSQRTQDSHRR
jgi:hypothetical protein